MTHRNHIKAGINASSCLHPQPRRFSVCLPPHTQLLYDNTCHTVNRLFEKIVAGSNYLQWIEQLEEASGMSELGEITYRGLYRPGVEDPEMWIQRRDGTLPLVIFDVSFSNLCE